MRRLTHFALCGGAFGAIRKATGHTVQRAHMRADFRDIGARRTAGQTLAAVDIISIVAIEAVRDIVAEFAIGATSFACSTGVEGAIRTFDDACIVEQGIGCETLLANERARAHITVAAA